MKGLFRGKRAAVAVAALLSAGLMAFIVYTIVDDFADLQSVPDWAIEWTTGILLVFVFIVLPIGLAMYRPAPSEPDSRRSELPPRP